MSEYQALLQMLIIGNYLYTFFLHNKMNRLYKNHLKHLDERLVKIERRLNLD